MESSVTGLQADQRWVVLLASTVIPSLALALAAAAGAVTGSYFLALGTIGLAVGCVGLCMLNEKVGYRWFDTALLAVPVYGAIYLARVLWRGASLPHARYWDDVPPSNEAYRTAAFGEYIVQDVPRYVSSLVSLALFPIDDDWDTSEAFEEKMDACALETAKQLRDADPVAMESIATEALESYIEHAKDFDEVYYVSRYAFAIDETNASAVRPPARERFGQITEQVADPVHTISGND